MFRQFLCVENRNSDFCIFISLKGFFCPLNLIKLSTTLEEIDQKHHKDSDVRRVQRKKVLYTCFEDFRSFFLKKIHFIVKSITFILS